MLVIAQSEKPLDIRDIQDIRDKQIDRGGIYASDTHPNMVLVSTIVSGC